VIKRNIDSIRELPYKNWDSLMSPVKEAHFYRDNYKKWPKSQRVSRMVLRLINNSKKELMIVSPYLIPPLKCMRALKAAHKRGVDITLISNSPQMSDAKIIAAAYMNDRRKYLKRNFHIYEYNGKKMLHDKIFMADDNTTIVGSYNFDNISYRMNAEIIAEIKDTAFAIKMNKHIQKRKLDCIKILNVKDKNPYNDASIVKKTKGNQMLLRIFPFIRRFL
jgi:phosphatidylserine/phosphatidylglycerophosphate/cardiolipin synthase-like enzyme